MPRSGPYAHLTAEQLNDLRWRLNARYHWRRVERILAGRDSDSIADVWSWRNLGRPKTPR